MPIIITMKGEPLTIGPACAGSATIKSVRMKRE